MTIKRGGLGRNLSALLGPTVSADTATDSKLLNIIWLTPSQLQAGKYQPRTDIDDVSLQELAESIKKQGLMQPLVVRSIDIDRYEIIAGERRWRACQMAGLAKIPVLVHHVDDETALAMALVENLQREDLNPVDQARAMQRLVDEFRLTHQQVADLLAKSRAAVSNYLRLLQLNPAVIRMLECNDLDMGHARCLLGLSAEQQNQVAALIVSKNLSVRETEALVNRVKEDKPKPIHSPAPLRFEALVQSLATHLAAPVKLKVTKAGQGKLIIHYHNEHDLEKMLKQIMGEVV